MVPNDLRRGKVRRVGTIEGLRVYGAPREDEERKGSDVPESTRQVTKLDLSASIKKLDLNGGN